jgi:hypothetical protein
MTTLDDQASDHEALFLKEALEFREPAPYHYGICGNCYQPSVGVYCSPECREDGIKRTNMTGKVL